MQPRQLFEKLHSIYKVLNRPVYLLVALSSTLIILGLLIWLFQIQTLAYVLGVPFLSIGEKLSYFFSGYTNSALYFFRDPVAFTRVIFSAMAGINIALYMFIRKHEQSVASQKGFGGFIVALLGSGCVACGASILSPLIVGASAGAVIIGVAVGSVGNILGIILMLYSINGFCKRITFEKYNIC